MRVPGFLLLIHEMEKQADVTCFFVIYPSCFVPWVKEKWECLNHPARFFKELTGLAPISLQLLPGIA